MLLVTTKPEINQGGGKSEGTGRKENLPVN
jgi:hypothetical protein